MKEQLSFIKDILIRPSEAFWEMKREGRGNFWMAIGCVALLIFNRIFARQATSFLFNYEVTPLNILAESRNILVVAVLFCLACWAVTALLDGESTMKNVIMMFGYATLPISLVGIPVTVFTNIATYNESVFIDFFHFFGMAWCVFILFMGLMSLNQYSALKTLGVTIVILITAGIIVFVYILFFTIISQLLGFVMALYKELMLRL